MNEMTRLAHGLWRDSTLAADRTARDAALLTAAPPGAVVAGLAAARRHGLWLPGPSRAECLEVVLRWDVDDQEAHAGSRRSEFRGRRRRLRPDEITVLDGIPVTTIARTWIDLAEALRAPDLVAAGDSALRSGATVAQLREATARAFRRRGVVRARTILPLLDQRSRSRPESHLRYGLVSRGLPTPQVNEPIYSAGSQWLAEPDLSYDDVKLAIEYNGADHASPDRMRRDITREVDVESRGGWRVVTVGPAQVFRWMDETALFIGRLRRERLRGWARSPQSPS